MAKSEILKPFILSWEGGFVNDHDDRGGATMKGVTLATFRQVYGQSRTVEELRRITDAQWMTIFRRYYWDRWKADAISSQSVANLLVDWVWASGRYGITIPQALLGVKVDGMVGPKTIAALNGYRLGQEKLFEALWNDRQKYIEMISRKGNNQKFKRGWLRRLDGIKYGRLVCNGGRTIYF